MPSLAELRTLIQGLHSPAGKQVYTFSGLSEGVPRGALVEICGPTRCEFIAKFLAETPVHTIWIEKKLSIYPTALLQRHVDLSRIYFVEGNKECPWVLSVALRSKAFPVIVYDCQDGDETEHRRWQLLAEKANATVWLIRKSAKLFWPITLSLEVNGKSVAILRRK